MDNKNVHFDDASKDLGAGLKREVDSLDDFEHLDSSPVGAKPPGAATKVDSTTAMFDPLISNKVDFLDFGEVKKPPSADLAASTFATGGPAMKEKDILSSFIERERGDVKIGHGGSNDRLLERFSDSENEDDFKLSKEPDAVLSHEEQRRIEEEQSIIEEQQRKIAEEIRREEEATRLERQKQEAEERQRLEAAEWKRKELEEIKRKEAEEKQRQEEEKRRKEEEERKKRLEQEERKRVEEEIKRVEEEKKPAEVPVCKKIVCDLKPKTAVTEAEAIFYRMGLDAWFNPERLNPKVESLIYWRDPKKSGPVFGGVLLVLLALTYFSLISVVAYLSLLVLTGTIFFRIYKNIVQAVQKTGDGHPFKDLLELDVSLSQDKVREVSEIAVAHFNAVVAELRHLFLVEDLVDSIKFGVLLWTLTYLGAVFNGMTLIIIAWVALFTFPKVYETNKTQIDANLEIVRTKLAEITSKVKAAIPIGKKAVEEKKEQ